MNDHEKLIKEAAKAMFVGQNPSSNWDEIDWGRRSEWLEDARTALAVFEKAHTPRAEVRVSAFGPIGDEPVLTLGEGWVRDLQSICSAAQCSTPGVTRGPSSYVKVDGQIDGQILTCEGCSKAVLVRWPGLSAEGTAAVSVGSAEPCQQIAEERRIT